MAIELLNEDCMTVMGRYPDNYFDLACVDPPYGINMAKKGQVGGGSRSIPTTKFTPKEWDQSPPKEEYFSELKRISKNQIVWGANHFADKFSVVGPCWIVWDKDNTGDFADCELAWTSFKTAVRKFEYRWNGMMQGDMKNKEIRIHPTQKPVKLYEWILDNYAKPGDKILDTHLGSGSSAIAAHYRGFDFVGCELDEDYLKAAVERFNNETRQVSFL